MEFAELEALLLQTAARGYAERAHIPAAPGVYAAWRRESDGCIYVGRASNLSVRVGAHFSGQRGSDQFCLYVYDRFVFETRPDGLTTSAVNGLTRDWIRANVVFRWITRPVADLAPLEAELRRHWLPLLNPLLPA